MYCFELALCCCWTNPLANRECELKATYANLTEHSVQQVQALYSIVVRWQTYVPDQDKLSKYGQDGTLQLTFAPKGMIAELESEGHFVHLALEHLLTLTDCL